MDKISARHQNWSKGDEATGTAERNSAATQIPNRNTNNHRRRSGQAETARNQNRRARAQKRAEANGNTITKTPDPTTAAAPTADDDPKRGKLLRTGNHTILLYETYYFSNLYGILRSFYGVTFQHFCLKLTQLRSISSDLFKLSKPIIHSIGGPVYFLKY